MFRFECRSGGHNKYYEFHGIEKDGRFTIKGLYGAIGQAPKEAIIYDGDSKTDANKQFDKKKKEKEKKGYVLVSNNGHATTKPTEKKTVIFL